MKYQTPSQLGLVWFTFLWSRARGQVDPGDAILRVLSDNIDDLHALLASTESSPAENVVEGAADMQPAGSEVCSADWRRLVLGLSSCVHARGVHRRALMTGERQSGVYGRSLTDEYTFHPSESAEALDISALRAPSTEPPPGVLETNPLTSGDFVSMNLFLRQLQHPDASQWLAQLGVDNTPGEVTQQAQRVVEVASTPEPYTTREALQQQCAWQAYVTRKKFNVAYPDGQAVYQILAVTNVDKNQVIRITGTFPDARVRYFSIQSNNPKVGFAKDTLRDYEIEAQTGKNPFVKAKAQGTYQVHVTLSGKQGLKNELALCPDGSCTTANAIIMMRFYTSDPNDPERTVFSDPPESRSNPRLFGYQAAPKVEVRDKGLFGPTWKQWPTCDQTQPTLVSSMLDNYLEYLIPEFPELRWPNHRDSFYMYLDEQTNKAGVFPNLDATYLVTNSDIDAVPSQLSKGRIIAKLTAKLPDTAQMSAKGPDVADWKKYDVRYHSVSTISYHKGGPTIDTLDDTKIRSRSRGLSKSRFDTTREFTVVMADDPLKTCGLYDKDADLFMTTRLDGETQDRWGVLYRQLISRYQRDRKADNSIGYARVACSKSTSDAVESCSLPSNLESTMKEYYPSIQYYVCDYSRSAQGVLTPLTTSLEEAKMGSGKGGEGKGKGKSSSKKGKKKAKKSKKSKKGKKGRSRRRL